MLWFNQSFFLSDLQRELGEWLGHLLAVLGVDGSNLLKAQLRCDYVHSLYASLLGSIQKSLGRIKVGHLPHSGDKNE